MSEERLMILKLLEEGKISEKEAEMLLDALGDEEYDQFAKDPAHSFQKDDPFSKGSSSTAEEGFERKMENFGKRMENLGAELEDKLEDFGEHFGKRMGHLGAEIADKSVNFAEKLVDVIGNIVESGSFHFDTSTRFKSYEEIIEQTINTNEKPTLTFKGINGKITIQQWNQDKIQVKASVKADPEEYKVSGPIVVVKEEGDSIVFSPKHLERLCVQLQVKLPARMYETIHAETVNASISIEKLQCNKLYCRTKNGSIQLQEISALEEIGCTSTNGKIILENTSTSILWAATKNSRITISDIQAVRIDLLTSNGKILAEQINYKGLKSIKMKTSNGSIQISDQLPLRGVDFDLLTSNGKIQLPSGIEYLQNVKSYSTAKVVAQYKHGGGLEESLDLKAYTTNGSIVLF